MISQSLATKSILCLYVEKIHSPLQRVLKRSNLTIAILCYRQLTSLKPDLFIRDSGSTIKKKSRKYEKLFPPSFISMILAMAGKVRIWFSKHFIPKRTIQLPDHYVVGMESFIADEQMASFKQIGLRKERHVHSPIWSFHLVMKMKET